MNRNRLLIGLAFDTQSLDELASLEAAVTLAVRAISRAWGKPVHYQARAVELGTVEKPAIVVEANNAADN